MRILIASVDFVPHRDGVSTLSYHYARRLSEQGHDVIVVGPAAPRTRQEDEAAPYQVYRFAGYAWGWMRFIPFAVCSLYAFLKHRPKVVFPMNIGYGGLVFYPFTLLGACHHVMAAYAYEFLKFEGTPILHNLYRRIYNSSLFTIAISEFTKGKLIDFGVAPERIRLSYPGIAAPDLDRSISSTEEERASAPLIGTCGRLIHRKGHDLVIRALPAIRKDHPGVKYIVAGKGPEKAALMKLACDLGVSDHVVFLGEVNDQHLPSFYARLDLFVMPSRDEASTGHAEGFGIVYLEAAMYGVPSVATRTGGIPEAVLHEKTGVLVEPDSEKELAQAISSLLSDRDRLMTYGRHAKERALNEFGWNVQVDKIHAWLGEIEP